MAVISAHEGQRQLGNTDLNAETFKAVMANTAMAKNLMQKFGVEWMDETLFTSVVMSSMGDEQLMKAFVDAAFDSSDKYWKIMKNGDIVWDGSSNVTDERTGEIKEFSSYSEGLAYTLGLTKEEAQALMNSQGARWNGSKWIVPDSADFGKATSERDGFLSNVGDVILSPFKMLAGFIKDVWNNSYGNPYVSALHGSFEQNVLRVGTDAEAPFDAQSCVANSVILRPWFMTSNNNLSRLLMTDGKAQKLYESKITELINNKQLAFDEA